MKITTALGLIAIGYSLNDYTHSSTRFHNYRNPSQYYNRYREEDHSVKRLISKKIYEKVDSVINGNKYEYYKDRRVGPKDITFDTKDDAWCVIDRLVDDGNNYGKVSVWDFMKYSGINNYYFDGNEKGWYAFELSNIHPVIRTDGRWIINFPPIRDFSKHYYTPHYSSITKQEDEEETDE